MIASFSDNEKNTLYGQSPKIALKHKCSSIYVNMIIKGNRKIKSEKSKAIYKDLQQLIKLLSPNS